jgi:hypothetical protein
MKKKSLIVLFLMVALLPLSSVSVMARTINFNVGYEDPQNPKDDDKRTLTLVPEVDLEDYTLTFYTPCDGCVLRLVDENDNVVYSTIISTGTTSLVLPSSLSGDYEIQIIQGNTYFYGDISL